MLIIKPAYWTTTGFIYWSVLCFLPLLFCIFSPFSHNFWFLHTYSNNDNFLPAITPSYYNFFFPWAFSPSLHKNLLPLFRWFTKTFSPSKGSEENTQTSLNFFNNPPSPLILICIPYFKFPTFSNSVLIFSWNRFQSYFFDSSYQWF